MVLVEHVDPALDAGQGLDALALEPDQDPRGVLVGPATDLGRLAGDGVDDLLRTLLGQQVMALGIDPKGSVKDCRIVSSSGEMKPDYGCDDATAEHFEASAATARTAPPREGVMTILVYGHSEHMV